MITQLMKEKEAAFNGLMIILSGSVHHDISHYEMRRQWQTCCIYRSELHIHKHAVHKKTPAVTLARPDTLQKSWI